MEDNYKTNIVIAIAGPVQSGKSVIAYSLMKILKEHNFDIVFKDEDFESIEQFEATFSKKKIDDALDAISSKSRVCINTVQTRREP
jgi:uridine kinase